MLVVVVYMRMYMYVYVCTDQDGRGQPRYRYLRIVDQCTGFCYRKGSMESGHIEIGSRGRGHTVEREDRTETGTGR